MTTRKPGSRFAGCVSAAPLALTLLAGCASTPPAIGPSSPPSPDAAACKALTDPGLDLRLLQLAAGRTTHDQPRYPALLAKELAVQAARAHAITSADPEMLKVASSAGDLLTALSEKARELAEATEAKRDTGPALTALVEATKSGGPVVQALDARCASRPVGATSVSGRLPPELIQKIVRARFPLFRACYENGLRTDPTLHGRVSIEFVIARDGTVSQAIDAERGSPRPLEWAPADRVSEPPLPALVSNCVLAVISSLTFPEPEGGIVTVGYPIQFSPGS